MIRLSLFDQLAIAAVVAPLFGTVLPVQAAAPHLVGQWDMSLDNTNRKCRVTLRPDAASANFGQGNFGVAMPFGCKRALPILTDVGAWANKSDTDVILISDSGKMVLDFSWGPDHASLISRGPDAEGYHLAPVRAGQVAANDAPAAPVGFAPLEKTVPKPAVMDNAAITAIAGRYMVVRDAKIPPNCAIMLDGGKPSPKGNRMGAMEKGCADKGIEIFNPVAWRLDGDHLVLVAKRGHEALFVHQADGLWTKDGKGGKALSLKKQ